MFCQHFLYRALFLIVVPALVYLGLYLVHFTLLTQSGTGDSVHSSRFQASLLHNYYHHRKTDLIVRNNSGRKTLLQYVYYVILSQPPYTI